MQLIFNAAVPYLKGRGYYGRNYKLRSSKVPKIVVPNFLLSTNTIRSLLSNIFDR